MEFGDIKPFGEALGDFQARNDDALTATQDLTRAREEQEQTLLNEIKKPYQERIANIIRGEAEQTAKLLASNNVPTDTIIDDSLEHSSAFYLLHPRMLISEQWLKGWKLTENHRSVNRETVRDREGAETISSILVITGVSLGSDGKLYQYRGGSGPGHEIIHNTTPLNDESIFPIDDILTDGRFNEETFNKWRSCFLDRINDAEVRIDNR